MQQFEPDRYTDENSPNTVQRRRDSEINTLAGKLARGPIEIDANAGDQVNQQPPQEPGIGNPDDVMLSPRIVDEAAFESYGGKLRALLEQISDRAKQVVDATEQSRAVKAELNKAAEMQRAQMEANTKLIKAMNARSLELEQMIGKAEQRIDTLSQRERQLDEMLSNKLAKLDSIAQQNVERMEGVSSGAVQQLNDISAQTSDQLSVLADEAGKHFASKQREVMNELESETQARIAAAQAEQEAQTLQTRDEMAVLITQLHEQHEKIEALAEGASSRTMEALNNLCTKAHEIAGITPGSEDRTPAEGSLGAIVQQAQSLRPMADEATAELAMIENRAKNAVTTLGDQLAESVMQLELSSTRQEKLAEHIETTLFNAQQAREEVDRCAERAKSVVEPIERVRNDAKASGERLAGVNADATRSVQRLVDQANQLAQMVKDIREAAATLEPWRDVLMGDGQIAPGTLPKPLAEIAESFRTTIGKDLAKMASAMSMIAQGADTSVRGPSPEVVIRPTTSEPTPATTAQAPASQPRKPEWALSSRIAKDTPQS